MHTAAGLAVSNGLSGPDAPALASRELTGAPRSGIKIGAPEPARLHTATKAAPRAVMYSHEDVAPLVARLAAEGMHRHDSIEIYEVDRDLIAVLAAGLERRTRFNITGTGRHLYVSVGDRTVDGAITTHRGDARS